MGMAVLQSSAGNVFLDDRSSVSWSLSAGTQPHVSLFQMDKAAAKVLLPGGFGSPVSLVIDSGVRLLRVDGLYVIGTTGSPDPWTATILVADARIWWNRQHIRRSYNIRRRSGSRRRQNDDSGTLVQVLGELDDISFRQSSLNNGTRYTARAMVREVLDLVTDKKWSGDLDQFPEKEVDGVELDDNGADALQRALAYLPGADVFVDRQGVTIVKNNLDLTGEQKVITRSTAAIEGGGVPEFVDLSKQRPKSVNVLYTIEQEVRLDFGTNVSGQALLVENVFPCPDETLEIKGVQPQTLLRGQWSNAFNYFGAWEPKITDDFVRRTWSSALIEEKFGLLGKLTTDSNWPARINTIRANYRQTYRIPKIWMDRFESIKNYRCSVLDLETGTFGTSPVWQDWAMTPSANGLLFGPDEQFFVINLPDGVDQGKALSGSKPAAFRLNIVDADLGIIAISPVADYQGNFGDIHPSSFVLRGTSQKRGKFPVSLDGMREGRSGASMELVPSGEHRMTTVITISPASPNSKGRLFKVPISFTKAKERLPTRSKSSLPSATGPEWDLRVSVTTARFAWAQEKAAIITRSLGAEQGFGEAELSQQEARARLSDLLCNKDEIDIFSETVAAALYSSMPDHFEGSKEVDMNQSIIPEGRIEAVVHTLETDGAATTTIVSPGLTRAEDPFALLPDSVRRLVQQQVQLGN